MGVEGGAHRLHKAVPVTQDGEFDEADGAGQGDQAGMVETLPN